MNCRRSFVPVLATVAVLVFLTLGSTQASAGIGKAHQYCQNMLSNNWCTTPETYEGGVYYGRSEMMGYHCTFGGDLSTQLCGTANFVYSRCASGGNYAGGRNMTNVRRNIDVWWFKSTGGDCNW